MRKLVVVEYVSLDGVMEAPEKWTFPYWNDQIAKFQSDQLMRSDMLLLGRTTFEMFAKAWPERKEGDFAAKMNSMPKLVVSDAPIKNPPWNGRIIHQDILSAIKDHKKQEGGDLLVYGSAMLLQTLMKHNLVDCYKLIVYPLVLGEGKRLFQDKTTASLQLTDVQTSDTGVAMLTYLPAATKA